MNLIGQPASVAEYSGIIEDAHVPVIGSPAQDYQVVLVINTGETYVTLPCDLEEIHFHGRH